MKHIRYISVILVLFSATYAQAAFTSDDFVITVETTAINETFTIPTTGGGYNYNVDCNNDSADDFTARTGNVTCTYETPGTHTVVIKDNSGSGVGFPRIYFNNTGDKLKIRSVEQWGSGTWTSFEGAFYGASNLVVNALDVPDTSTITSFANAFRATNISTFNNHGWDTGSVTSFAGTFRSSPFNGNIGSWNTASATTFNSMFAYNSDFDQDISGWNTSEVLSLTDMFIDATSFDQPLDSWDVAKVSLFHRTFSGATSFDQDLNSWDTRNATSMYQMFGGATAFDGNVTSWQLDSNPDLSLMFSGASSFNQNISFKSGGGNRGGDAWNLSGVTTMSAMFSGASSFNQDVSNWDTSTVTGMADMFHNASSFNQNLAAWDMTNVGGALRMFRNTAMTTQNYDQTLIGWADQSLKSNVDFRIQSGRTYCDAEAERQILISTYNWDITGDAKNCAAYVPEVAFTVATSSTSETGDGDQPTLTISNGIISSTSTITLSISGGTASPEDHSFSTVVVTLPIGDFIRNATTTAFAGTPVDDDIDEQDETVILSLTNPTGDVILGSLATHTLTIIDNDAAGVTLSATSTQVVEGANVTYTVVLDTEPTATTTVTVTADNSEAAPSPALLTFTDANWNNPQTVIVTGADDALVDGSATSTVSHVASSSDANYNGIAIDDLAVTVTDNDTAGGGSYSRIETLDADINNASNTAVLHGEINDKDAWTVYFVFSEETNPKCEDDEDVTVYELDDTYDDGDEFSYLVTGLYDDTKYYYQACGFYDGDDEIRDGGYESFTLKDDGVGNPVDDEEEEDVEDEDEENEEDENQDESGGSDNPAKNLLSVLIKQIIQVTAPGFSTQTSSQSVVDILVQQIVDVLFGQ